MRIWLLITALPLLLMGCDDEKAAAEMKNLEQAAAQRGEEHQARLDAEQRLMSDLATARPELEKRISDWINVSDGTLFVVEGRGKDGFQSYAIPASTPWVVTCNRRAIELTLGSWREGEDSSLFTRRLSFARLSEDQCKPLIAIVAQRMQVMTRSLRPATP